MESSLPLDSSSEPPEDGDEKDQKGTQMHIFPPDTSIQFQKLGTSTRTFPNLPAIAAKFASSQASTGTPTILSQAILPTGARAFPKESTQMNHLSQIPLLALKTSAALSVLNLMATCIPPKYFVSSTSYPSNAKRDGKLQIVSKLRISPTRTDFPAQLLISGTHSRMIAGGAADVTVPLAISANELAPLTA
ncbi:hypothetical protein LXL04_028436 [Taraxacum kok-saghyz]